MKKINLSTIKGLELYDNYELWENGELHRLYYYNGKAGKNLECDDIYTGSDGSSGYKRFYLTNNSIRVEIQVHRLYALCFIPIPDKYKNLSLEELAVDHIDNDKQNNNPKNLQWLTNEENSTKACKDGLYKTGMDTKKSKLMIAIKNNKPVYSGNSQEVAEAIMKEQPHITGKKTTIARALRMATSGKRESAYGYKIYFV